MLKKGRCPYCKELCVDIRFTEKCPRQFYCDGKIDISELRRGYDIITGCDNAEMSDNEIMAYMAEAMKV